MYAGILTLYFAMATAGGDESADRFPKPTGPASKAAAQLKKAKSVESNQMPAIIKEAVKLLSPESPAGALLSAAAGSNQLPRVVENVAEMLAFEPVREADLPHSFPTYTPVGAIEIKTYPKSRRAVADDFFTLFGHITGNNIAMTAPVRMEFTRDEDGDLTQQSMAFYYPKVDIGEPGARGNVRTLDDDGEVVVAIGCRGEMNDKSIEEARKHLQAWLKANPEYELDGDVVAMGYNSPMIPKESNFFEVQLPVRKATGE